MGEVEAALDILELGDHWCRVLEDAALSPEAAGTVMELYGRVCDLLGMAIYRRRVLGRVRR